MIHFVCRCGRQLQAKEEYAGRRTRCPECGREQIIPDLSAAVEPADSPITALTPTAPSAADWTPSPEVAEAEAAYRGPPPRTTSGKAIASLILGIGSLLCTLFTGIPAIILGVVGLTD